MQLPSKFLPLALSSEVLKLFPDLPEYPIKLEQPVQGFEWLFVPEHFDTIN